MLFNEPEIIKLDDKGSELVYYPQWIGVENSETYYQSLLSETDWQQDEITLYGKTHLLPRKTAWYGDVGISYAYSGIQMKAEGWTPLLSDLKKQLEETSGCEFNSVLLNYYPDGNAGMGWHSDDEPELGVSPVIASLSFGETRRFDLKPKQGSGVKSKSILLESGSLLIMRGKTQRYWQHSIAKSAKVRGSRINLTFRYVHLSNHQ